MDLSEFPLLLTPGETAGVLRVSVKTLGRWERDGLISAVKTAGGHRRYRRAEVARMVNGEPETLEWEPEG